MIIGTKIELAPREKKTTQNNEKPGSLNKINPRLAKRQNARPKYPPLSPSVVQKLQLFYLTHSTDNSKFDKS